MKLCEHGTTCPQCEADDRKYNDAVEREAREVERHGGRLVDGGQLSSPDHNGHSDWRVTDYRTGETLASGHGTPDDMDAAWQDGWWHIDFISECVLHEMPIEPDSAVGAMPPFIERAGEDADPC